MHPVPIHHGTGLFLFHKRVLHGCKFDLHKCIQENFQLFFCLNLRMAELLPLFSPPKHLPCAKDHKGRQIYHHHAGSGRCGKLVGCHHSQKETHKG